MFNKCYLKDFLILGIVLGIWFGIWLGARPLSNPDESRYAGIALHMVVSGNYTVPKVNGVIFLDKPFLSYWLNAAAIHFSGFSNAVVRFSPAFFAWLGCLITYAVGATLFSRRAGILSAAILATSILYVILAHYVNMDMEVGMCIAGALGLFLVGQRKVQAAEPASAWFFSSYFFAALGFLFKGLIGIALPGLVILVWMLIFFQWKNIFAYRIGIGIVIVAVLALPYYFFIESKTPGFLHYFFAVEQFQRYVQTGFNNAMPFWFYFPVIIGGVFPWSFLVWPAVVSNWKADREEHRVAETGFLVLWILAILIFFSVPISKLVGYIIPVIPAFALLVGRYIDNIWGIEPPKSLVKYLSGAAIVSGLLGIAGAILLWTQQNGLSIHLVYGGLITCAIWFVGAIWMWKKRLQETRRWFFAWIVTIALTLLSAVFFSANYVSPDSVVALLQQLKTTPPSNATIAAYQDYFEDLPLAFPQHPVSVVADWKNKDLVNADSEIGHFAYGLQLEPADKSWLISEDAFWKQWNAAAPVWVFVDVGNLPHFKDQALAHYQQVHLLQQWNGIALVSNQATS